ncbi:histidine triad nucleotide-binding protein [Hydrocarboniphaga sp.]|uniref:histidine triad nucleotide-binding protein n=1 Tax=Hydrocarboniphaga sp. TaxID=2033016 RepID=UPI003D0B0C75
MARTLFEKIIAKEIPASFLYEDELCVAIRDINPQAPLHALIIPRQMIAQLSHAKTEDQALLGHLMLVANRIAADAGYGNAFRLVVNNGAEAGQSVFHIHVHVLGGRPLSWPPG